MCKHIHMLRCSHVFQQRETLPVISTHICSDKKRILTSSDLTNATLKLTDLAVVTVKHFSNGSSRFSCVALLIDLNPAIGRPQFTSHNAMLNKPQAGRRNRSPPHAGVRGEAGYVIRTPWEPEADLVGYRDTAARAF